MISKLLMIVAGVFTIVTAWLPWLNVLGTSQNGFMGDLGGNPGIVFIVMGALIALMGIVNKKWSAIIAILIAICVSMLGLKYYNDATTGDAITIGASPGYGLYCMFTAGLIGILGGFIRLFTKKNKIVA